MDFLKHLVIYCIYLLGLDLSDLFNKSFLHIISNHLTAFHSSRLKKKSILLKYTSAILKMLVLILIFSCSVISICYVLAILALKLYQLI